MQVRTFCLFRDGRDFVKIVFILFIAFFIIISLFNIIMAIKRNKKYVIIFSAVFYSIFLILLLLQCSNEYIIKRDSEKYSIYGKGIFGVIYYERTEDDYYILKECAFLSPYTEIAVPKENIHIPFITKYYKPVYVYCMKDTDLYKTQITINSEKYESGDTIVKIRPNPLDFTIIVGVYNFMALCLFNVVSFFCILFSIKKRHKN